MSTESEPSFRKRIVALAILLGGSATLAAALLISGNLSTGHAIAAREAEDLLRSLSQVLPDDLHDNNLLENTVQVDDGHGGHVTVYRALRKHRITGYAWRTTAHGYSGDISLLLGVDQDGTLLGVRVLAHTETPGLGDRIELDKDHWILGFNGHSLANTSGARWHVKKDGGEFDQFSGATITPRGVTRAVYEGLEFFAAHQAELADNPADKQHPPGEAQP
jgi:electron transport complex protein RnfG